MHRHAGSIASLAAFAFLFFISSPLSRVAEFSVTSAMSMVIPPLPVYERNLRLSWILWRHARPVRKPLALSSRKPPDLCWRHQRREQPPCQGRLIAETIDIQAFQPLFGQLTATPRRQLP